MEIGENWHKWKEILGNDVGLGEKMGLDEETINNAAYHLGNFFANNFDPANKEQRLMKELWDEANEDERKSMAAVMTRLAHKASNH
ncbi:hypothetical protein Desca_2211 [Desulfotomaculum nigrificans CO-1-SRB]|uniref:DUF3243 domain-containing protein n=1 Tax=Desulfotomaculum nigrificans (strain DSM 14880 / VKM B-2319 / CO-1-SRB) TaxID=868595 RepID=F6B2U1_DESCC|nr:DUF3243 domain-containing protein [Desulfotomaculum nigrificans]AEF95049.1 hypothetical protein Desca_2211 [Desulfotomaculum nigrificans CO-1-SRB]